MPRRSSAPLLLPDPSVAAPTPKMLVQQVRTLLAEAQALSARLAALNEVAVTVQASLDTEEVLRTFAREARWVLDYQVCSIAIREGPTYIERTLCIHNLGAVLIQQLPIQIGVISSVLSDGQAKLIGNLAADDRAPAGMASALILPLRHAGVVVGTVNFFAHAAHHYTVDDLRIAHALAVQVAVVFQNARLFSAATRARDELNAVLESISDAVLVVDNTGTIVLLNAALIRMLNLPENMGAGRRVPNLLRLAVRHDRRLITRVVLHDFIAAYRSHARGVSQLTDGVHVEWAVVPFVSSELNGYVLTARDVSDRVNLEQLRDDMIGMLVHDLRTPLTSMIMGLDLMGIYAAQQPMNPDADEVLQHMRSSSNRLLQQVNTILDVRKLEAGRIDLRLAIASIAGLVNKALAPLHTLFEQSSQTISLDIAPDLPLVEVDVSLIVRVLENLAGNAHKFTQAAGEITIGARQSAQAGFLEVFVRDNGVGVPAALREHIFEKYGQVAGEHTRRGTGLGLYFCKLAIESHGGAIGVRVAPGSGSLFWFTLPIASGLIDADHGQLTTDDRSSVVGRRSSVSHRQQLPGSGSPLVVARAEHLLRGGILHA